MKRKFSMLIITMAFCSLAWSQSTPAATPTPSGDQKVQRRVEINKHVVGGMEQVHEGMGLGQGDGQGFGRQGFGHGMGRGMGRGRAAGFTGGRGAGHRGANMRWWKNAEMAKHINLTETQTAQLDKIWQDARLKNIDLRADTQKQQALLQPLMESESPDETKILQQIDRVASARTALAKAAVSEHLAMHKVLTPEQIKKLQAFHEAHAPHPIQMNMRRPSGNMMHRSPRPNGGDYEEDDDDDN